MQRGPITIRPVYAEAGEMNRLGTVQGCSALTDIPQITPWNDANANILAGSGEAMGGRRKFPRRFRRARPPERLLIHRSGPFPRCLHDDANVPAYAHRSEIWILGALELMEL